MKHSTFTSKKPSKSANKLLSGLWSVELIALAAVCVTVATKLPAILM